MSAKIAIVAMAMAVVVLHGAAAAPATARDLKLKLIFKVSGGTGEAFFPADLLFSKGQITGIVTAKHDGAKYACPVQSGSTDNGYNLKMTCSVENGIDIVTFAGKLNLLTGNGRGTVSDTFYHETGNYIASKVIK
jgi:hypothetical protein